VGEFNSPGDVLAWRRASYRASLATFNTWLGIQAIATTAYAEAHMKIIKESKRQMSAVI
jgi:hypothetical protein